MAISNILLLLPLFLFGISTAFTLVQPKICLDGSRLGNYLQGHVYHYDFNITQNITITSTGGRQTDTQSIHLTGNLFLRRTELCGLEMLVPNGKVRWANVQNEKNEESFFTLKYTLSLEGSIITPVQGPSWKNAITRSLIDMIITDVKGFSQEVGPNIVTEVSIQLNWTEDKTKCIRTRSWPRQKTVNDTLEELRQNAVYRFERCDMKILESIDVIGDAVCTEEQVTVGGSQMITATSTKAVLKYIDSTQSDSLPAYQNLEQEQNVRGQIENVLMESGICQNQDQDGEELLEYFERLRRLIPFASVMSLKHGETLIKQLCKGENGGLKKYHYLLATTPSNDVVKVLKDAIDSGTLDSDVFHTFLKTIGQMPATKREEKWAEPESYLILKDLIKERRNRNHRMSDKDFIIFMAGFLNKVKGYVSGALQSFSDELLKMTFHEKFDRSTVLEVIRNVNIAWPGYADDKCLGFAVSDIEKLKCLTPCGNRFKVLTQNLAKNADNSDIQIAAYIYSKRCPNVTELIDPTDGELQKFIEYHKWSVGGKVGNPPNEPSKIGKTFAFRKNHVSSSTYNTTDFRGGNLTAEINILMGKDSIPILLLIEVEEELAYGKEPLFEIELMRLQVVPEKEGAFEILLTFRQGGVTTWTNSLPFDKEKIKAMFEGVMNSAKSQKSKALMNNYLRKLFANREIKFAKSFLLEDRKRDFETLSGLPVRTNVRMEGLFSLDYKWDVKWVDGEYNLQFKFHPNLSWRRTESATISYGCQEIAGYQIGAFHTFNMNFGLNFITSHDQRTMISKLIFTPAQSDTTGKILPFLQNKLRFMELTRIQYLLGHSNSKALKSPHLWLVAPGLNKVDRQFDIDLEQRWPLLEKGNFNLTFLKHKKPFYVSTQTFVTLPNIIIALRPHLEETRASIEVSLHPENRTKENTYSAKLAITTNKKTYSKRYALHFSTPNGEKEFAATVVSSNFEKSLKLETRAGNVTTAAYEVYMTRKQFDSLTELDSLRLTKLQGLKMDENVLKFSGNSEMTEWSHKLYKMGLRAWLGPEQKEITVLESAILYMENQLMHFQLLSSGVHDKVDSEINFLLFTVPDKKINSAESFYTGATLEMWNALLGQATLFGQQIESNSLNTHTFDATVRNDIGRVNYHLNGTVHDTVNGNGNYTISFQKLPGFRYILEGDLFKENGTIQGNMNEDGWQEPVQYVISTKLPRYDDLNPHTNIQVFINDSQHVYVDGKYDCSSNASKIYLLVKDAFELVHEGENSKIFSSTLDLLAQDIRLKTDFKLIPSTLKMLLSATSIENPRLRYFIFDTQNEMSYTNASRSIHELSAFWEKIGFTSEKLPTTSLKFSSKTKLRIKTISQRLTIAGQILPEEDPTTPSLQIIWVLPTSDRFLLEMTQQFAWGPWKLDGPNSSPKKPITIVGHWMTLEQPGYSPFSTKMVLRHAEVRGVTERNGEKRDRNELTRDFQFKLDHDEFFIPGVVTSIQVQSEVKNSMEWLPMPNEKEGYTVYEPRLKDHFWNINFTSQGPQRFPEIGLTSINIGNYTFKDKIEEYSATGYFKDDRRKIHKKVFMNKSWKMDFDKTERKVGSPENILDIFMQTAGDDDSLYVVRNELEYGLSSKEQDEMKFYLTNNHQFEGMYASWREFEYKINHRVNSSCLKTSWEDKLFSAIPTDNEKEGQVGISSSNLFDLSVTEIMGVDEQGSLTDNATLTFKIIPGCWKTNVVSVFNKIENENTQLLVWNTSCDSVLLQKPSQILLSSNSTFDAEESGTVDVHKTRITYIIPSHASTMKGVIESTIKQKMMPFDETRKAILVSHDLLMQRLKDDGMFQHLNLTSMNLLINEGQYPSYIHHNATIRSIVPGGRILQLAFAISSPSNFHPQILSLMYNNDFQQQFDFYSKVNNAQGLAKMNDCTGMADNQEASYFLKNAGPDDLRNIYNSVMHCKTCGSYSRHQLDNVSGYICFHSENNLQDKRNMVAKWDQSEFCDATMNVTNRANQTSQKDLSQGCTDIVKKIRGKVPCLVDQRNEMCDASGKTMQENVWKTVSRPLQRPFLTTLVVDTVAIGVWHFTG